MERIAQISKRFVSNTYHKCDLKAKNGTLKNKTILITGASRGIGLEIARRAAKDGANIAILAKTVTPHPKLPGTIYTAAEELKKLGGNALPIKCDIRFEKEVQNAIDETVKTFGGIDIVINNASAIKFKNAESMSMKEFDLIQTINGRGTFLTSKLAIPHLKKSQNPHILILSPPLCDLAPEWLQPCTGYAIGKYTMSLISMGLAEELKPYGIAVNALWPRTSIATAAVSNELGGEAMMRTSRKEKIMGDSAYEILTCNSKTTTGEFFIDDEVLASVGVKDFNQYKCNPEVSDNDLTPDFFLNSKEGLAEHLNSVKSMVNNAKRN